MSVDARLTPEGISTILLVLGGWSILWKDNPWNRLATNILMAASAGNLALVGLTNVRNLGWTPLINQGMYIRIIPIILGLLTFARFYKKVAYLVRFPVSLMVGVGTGLMVVGRLDAMIVRQIAVFPTLFRVGLTPLQLVSNVVFIVTFATSLYYFIFSLPLTNYKPARYIQTIGRWSMMIMLGLYFGSTVLNRLSMTLPAILFMFLGIRSG